MLLYCKKTDEYHSEVLFKSCSTIDRKYEILLYAFPLQRYENPVFLDHQYFTRVLTLQHEKCEGKKFMQYMPNRVEYFLLSTNEEDVDAVAADHKLISSSLLDLSISVQERLIFYNLP
uniref:Uncharacterized protein n=1 Tax=Romanomermis culicivorax TaxID=13658 RepID=A0A915IKW1_ROMCU